MTQSELSDIKERLEDSFKKFSSTGSHKIVPPSLTLGKIYEAFVLSLIIQELVEKENLYITLENDKNLTLQSGPGKIDRTKPHFSVYRTHSDYCRNRKMGELWTDVEFLALSYKATKASTPTNGEFHELDIVFTKPDVSGRPKHSDIILGVECKATAYGKNLLREILGIRRELSYLKKRQKTHFNTWPALHVNANPPSCLLVYGTDPRLKNYSKPGKLFSIGFHYKKIS
ncbi:hypothetical protein LVD17_00040 [Fulvivirga ulvae]|uniref:hypothetical protein n=1 Tax=Fulvivirga ulvae TaxID=2904245 RepID=UPI001F157F0C|nr:hypothetical protein [Fulvivirga ulvae]UII32193.1 hypothetical protein LVD17_28310 [Fulvivirga ulvae]UII32225.1 hypothetical protein LVD17_00040 [Fulvivirga ulvae]